MTSNMISIMTDNSTMNTDLERIFKSHHPVYRLSCYVYVKSPGFKRAIFGFKYYGAYR